MQNVTPVEVAKHLQSGNDQYGQPIRQDFASWGVMFQSNGQDAVREMGRHHGFNDYDGAVQWVEDNKHRAASFLTSYYVFCWP